MLSDDQTGQQSQPFAADTTSPALDGAVDADPMTAAPAATEPGYLLFRCAGVDCAVPLVALREVLPHCPAALPLPHSPEWLLGVFALRAELMGLADPAPLLFGNSGDLLAPRTHSAALLAGTGERVLAWAVESLGATAPLTPEMGIETNGDQPLATMPDFSDGQDLPGALGVPEPSMAAPYVGGVIASSGRRYTVIQVGALLADMLHALEERPAEA